MVRLSVFATLLACLGGGAVHGQAAAPAGHLVYTPNHRATYEQQWTFTFPQHQSTRWIIALRYPPELPWNRQAQGKAELLTGNGWRPFKEVRDGSKEHRRMLLIDYPHQDPKLRHGFTIRTTLAATLFDQHLEKGQPTRPAVALTAVEKESYQQATTTFDFHKPAVKKWMDEHDMWKRADEQPLGFVHRVYKELRLHLPYKMRDDAPLVCSQILQTGFGECARHSIVGTSILRANKISARTVCGVWAIDSTSKGSHCWGEFFLDGTGWVPYDTTYDGTNLGSEAYFGHKCGEVLASQVDFDYVISAGPFGKQTVFAMEGLPAYWSVGTGTMANPQVETSSQVRLVKQAR
jgi:hypothetical protein